CVAGCRMGLVGSTSPHPTPRHVRLLESYAALVKGVKQALNDMRIHVFGRGSVDARVQELWHVEPRCSHDSVRHTSIAHLIWVLEDRAVELVLLERRDFLGRVVVADQGHLFHVHMSLLEGLLCALQRI